MPNESVGWVCLSAGLTSTLSQQLKGRQGLKCSRDVPTATEPESVRVTVPRGGTRLRMNVVISIYCLSIL
jgi:hypothetical protein